MSGQQGKVSLVYKIKETVVKTSLLSLGVAFELASATSRELKDEIAGWDEGRILSLGVLPDGPAIAVRKEGDRLRYLGKGHHDSQLRILFKNIDAGLMTLTGQIGAHTAFSEHRAIVHGSLDEAMQANRAMAITTKFLFPRLMLNRITKRPPPKCPGDLATKARVMMLLTPMLLINMAK